MGKNVIFLLGGHDLEMQEIRSILNEKKIKYLDQNLSWGVQLSDYQEELLSYQDNRDYIIYGVELIADIFAPSNYKEIDRHNKNSHEPSSLEQVAKVLDLELTPRQKLVAANDSGHIKGMYALGLTDKDITKASEELKLKPDIDIIIKEIRRHDRKAQGFTEEMEKKAREDIKNSQNIDGVIIVKSTAGNKFSAITDFYILKKKYWFIQMILFVITV